MATANIALKSVDGPAPKADFAEQQRDALQNMRPAPNAPRPDAVFTPADKFRDEGDTQPFKAI